MREDVRVSRAQVQLRWTLLAKRSQSNAHGMYIHKEWHPCRQHVLKRHSLGTGVLAVRPSGQSQGQKPATKARVRARDRVRIMPRVGARVGGSGLMLRVRTGVR